MGKRKSSGKPSDAVSVEVDTSELDKFSAALPGKIDSTMADALRTLGEKVINDAERSLRAGSSQHGGRSRRQAAKGLKFVVRKGQLTLRSDSSGMEPGRAAFPAAWNSRAWVHPVFGRRDKVSQRSGAPGWWAPGRYADEADKALNKAGQRAIDEASR